MDKRRSVFRIPFAFRMPTRDSDADTNRLFQLYAPFLMKGLVSSVTEDFLALFQGIYFTLVFKFRGVSWRWSILLAHPYRCLSAVVSLCTEVAAHHTVQLGSRTILLLIITFLKPTFLASFNSVALSFVIPELFLSFLSNPTCVFCITQRAASRFLK